MSAVSPYKHCSQNFLGVRYKKTYVFFIIVHFLGFGLAVFMSWNQRSPVKQCIHATVKFTNMKETKSRWNLAPSVNFCCLIQLPEKYNHTACRGKTALLFTCGAKLLDGLVAPSAAQKVKCIPAIKKNLIFQKQL